MLNLSSYAKFYRGQHQIEVSALDDKMKCLHLELEKTKKSSHETSLQLETKVCMLLISILSTVVYFLNLSWIRVISKHHVVHEYETCATGGRNVFICMKMTEFLSDYDKTSALNYWHKSTNCHAL